MLSFTICFIRQDDRLLLVNRQDPAWMGSWNGVGGRIDPPETPLQCVLREVREETEIILAHARFAGVVTWCLENGKSDGMYAYVADLPAGALCPTPRATEEGILDWKQLSWILHPANTGVAWNLPCFLPAMLEEAECHEHHFRFSGGRQMEYMRRPLPAELAEGAA